MFYAVGDKVIMATPGKIDTGTISLYNTSITFHSHPSGTDSKNQSFKQYPSDIDIKNAEGSISYVSGRSNGIVYIYDGNGVLSKMPYKWFVRFR